MIDPKERFSNRVDDYVRYRPGYPAGLFEFLRRECGLGTAKRVVDLGSGTGILTRGLLETTAKAGAQIIAIEPNASMRTAAEKALSGEPRFESVDASAERTGLPSASVDLVVAAQAFHWFEPVSTRAELARVLVPGGIVALVWNQRRDTRVNTEYLKMLERFAPEYPRVRESERSSEPKMRAFFAPATPRVATFPNAQHLDGPGFRGRLFSSSYAPREGDATYTPMVERLEAIFRDHAENGVVTVDYETIVWYAAL
jgi:SAM-dependent methyltransferase